MHSESVPTNISHRILAGVIDLLFPPSCPNCSEPVDNAGTLCAICWPKITFMSDPQCACCGLPFEFDLGNDIYCASCLKKPPAFTRARAVMKYDDQCRNMVLGFKHADKTELAIMFSHWMMRAGNELIEDCDVIIPVPLHRLRLIKRRFNQSALLAKALSKSAGKQKQLLTLERHKATPTQGGLNANLRRKNVNGAFRIRPKNVAAIRGKKVLLVDDVLTTGATVNACTKTLLAAGAHQVDVITLCRVIRASSLSI